MTVADSAARLARHFDPQERPGRLDVVGLDRRLASRGPTLGAPDGFSGHVLNSRQDLVAGYATGRALVQLAWAERGVLFDWQSRPAWLAQTAEHANLWRRVEVRRYG